MAVIGFRLFLPCFGDWEDRESPGKTLFLLRIITQFVQDGGEALEAFADSFSFFAEDVAEEFDVLVDEGVVGIDGDGHGGSLEGDLADGGVGGVVQFFEAVGAFHVLLGFADEEGEVEDAMEGEFLGLAGPFLAGVTPDFGGDVHAAAVVPLGEAEGEAHGVGVADVLAVDPVVVFDDDDGFVFEVVGDFHGGGFCWGIGI